MQLLLVFFVALLVGGCATPSPDGGFAAVRDIVDARGGKEARWSRTDAERGAVDAAVRDLLSRPLSIDDAVRIALIQPHIEPGETCAYEFVVKDSGTFMYHPHSDEMMQLAMGMHGSLIVHPRDPLRHRVDRDFVFLINAHDIDPGTATPRVNTMLDFNLWTFNSRVFPGIDPLVVRKGDRVRIRMGNLSMTSHPIHLHGFHFTVTGTDGGWVPASARGPEATIDVPVGAVRTIEFVADEPGDWPLHCHKSHHTMNAMGHNVPTMIGVRQDDVLQKITKLVPDYLAMGEKGMADMGAMEMPLPSNTLPMMTGEGPFGALEMGGMFTVVKVREGLARGDYEDPGWYEHPKGTVAYRVDDKRG